MAERRMFAKCIVESDSFLDMPLTTQALYLHLGMNADDDGFVGSPKRIVRECGANEDDLKLLLAKRFILGFENGIVVIKHWKINNYIAKDRYKETAYKEQKALLQVKDNNSYTECIQDVYKMDTQYSIGKNSIGKNSIDNSISNITKCYEENIGLLTPSVAEKLFSYKDDLPDELICEAIKITSRNGVRRYNYIKKILDDWISKGFKTLLDVENENKNRISKDDTEKRVMEALYGR